MSNNLSPNPFNNLGTTKNYQPRPERGFQNLENQGTGWVPTSDDINLANQQNKYALLIIQYISKLSNSAAQDRAQAVAELFTAASATGYFFRSEYGLLGRGGGSAWNLQRHPCAESFVVDDNTLLGRTGIDALVEVWGHDALVEAANDRIGDPMAYSVPDCRVNKPNKRHKRKHTRHRYKRCANKQQPRGTTHGQSRGTG